MFNGSQRYRVAEISGRGTYPSGKRISELPIAYASSGLAGLSVLLDGLLDSRAGSGEILGTHGRGDGEPCVEGEEPWLGDGGNLRGVLPIENDEAAAFAELVGDEVGCFGFEVIENSLHFAA
jgi:hypothetical protein